MGYVHSPHDHPENTDKELATAIKELISAQERMKKIRNGALDGAGIQWMAVADHELNTAIMHLFLTRIDGVKHQIALAVAEDNAIKMKYWQGQKTALQKEGHDHGNE